MTAINVNESSRNTVYAAIELSKKNWVLGIAIDGMSCVLGSTFRRMI